ncbi:MAG: hypothetical protein FGF52_02650 [Candidatus Brockarchaeota archaeon]|nr:hypothetical protein [Candidatus Brockarchaeota archaeon]
MTIVRVDESGMATIPREIGVRGTRAIVIPAGSFLTIPLPQSPREEEETALIIESLNKTPLSFSELKKRIGWRVVAISSSV